MGDFESRPPSITDGYEPPPQSMCDDVPASCPAMPSGDTGGPVTADDLSRAHGHYADRTESDPGKIVTQVADGASTGADLAAYYDGAKSLVPEGLSTPYSVYTAATEVDEYNKAVNRGDDGEAAYHFAQGTTAITGAGAGLATAAGIGGLSMLGPLSFAFGGGLAAGHYIAPHLAQAMSDREGTDIPDGVAHRVTYVTQPDGEVSLIHDDGVPDTLPNGQPMQPPPGAK